MDYLTSDVFLSVIDSDIDILHKNIILTSLLHTLHSEYNIGSLLEFTNVIDELIKTKDVDNAIKKFRKWEEIPHKPMANYQETCGGSEC